METQPATLLIVKCTPEAFEELFRTGNKIECIVGVPETHRLVSYGFNERKNEFWLMFSLPGIPEGTEPESFRCEYKRTG